MHLTPTLLAKSCTADLQYLHLNYTKSQISELLFVCVSACLSGQSPDCTLVQSKDDDFDWEQGDTRDHPGSSPWIPAGLFHCLRLGNAVCYRWRCSSGNLSGSSETLGSDSPLCSALEQWCASSSAAGFNVGQTVRVVPVMNY